MDHGTKGKEMMISVKPNKKNALLDFIKTFKKFKISFQSITSM